MRDLCDFGANSGFYSPKKSLNVDSPSFTPTSTTRPSKKPTFSSQAVTAPSFTPRGLGATTPAATPDSESVFNPATIREFTPSFDLSSSAALNGSSQDGSTSYEAFSVTNPALPSTPFNPYAEDHTSLANAGPNFYQTQGSFGPPLQPLQYHLYAPIGPYKEDTMPYHRHTHDFFLPEKLREDLQKKAEASLQVMPNSHLPQLDNYHSLVALDTTHRKNASIFGCPSWVYKAMSSKSGHLYCLRRLEGFRLMNEQAILSVKEWRRVLNSNVVSIHDAFTTRAFGDSSLIFVQDYHPLAKTLSEVHLNNNTALGGRFQPKVPITEAVLWGYISQIANALKSIHSHNLAARCIDPSKIILTDKNRIRLNACSILDVVHFETKRSIQELQQEDLMHFGRTILCLATSISPAQLGNLALALEQTGHMYSPELNETITWLLTPPQPPMTKSIDEFIQGISGHVIAALDQAQHFADSLNSELCRELENGRIARLMMKLGVINERQEFDNDRAWSENGERYTLKLFRDFAFHQADANGNPVLDIGHMIRCLNKLDAGIEERICLTSRDEQTSFLITYKELKKQLAVAFTDLQKITKPSRSF